VLEGDGLFSVTILVVVVVVVDDADRLDRMRQPCNRARNKERPLSRLYTSDAGCLSVLVVLATLAAERPTNMLNANESPSNESSRTR